tara:strand:+ start:28 stop:321 length:294 start_codon:yes stop_codon:yes gene_type:complete
MKVKIQHRSVYHKFAEVEIKIDKKHYQEYIKFNTTNGNQWHDIQDYLSDNENLWADKIDKAISKAKYEFGFGLGDGMDEGDQDSEWRYETEKEGGHL